jgi:CubicO group peptidase (beta-lactamase class C family)
VRTTGLVLGVTVLLAAACSDGSEDADGTARTSVATAAPPDAAAEPGATDAPATDVPATDTAPPPATDSTTAPVAAQPGPGYPPQPADVPYPTEEWPEGDLPAGVDRAAIDAAAATAFADGAPERVRAVVVVHGGRIVYEAYSPHRDDRRAAVLPGYSINKSVTAALVGVLVREGRVDVDAPAPVAAWGADDPRAAITLDQLMRMTSGLGWAQEGDPGGSDLDALLAADDGVAYASSRELVAEPGSTFRYSDSSTMLVSGVLADLVGRGSDFDAFLEAGLLDPLGMRLETDHDPAGTWYAPFGGDATARDFARLGLLHLRDGVWDGVRLLPEGWVDHVRTPTAANPEYGAGWWLDLERPDVFYAVGVRGQVIGVDVAHDLVFVQLATSGAVSLPLSEAILDAFAV